MKFKSSLTQDKYEYKNMNLWELRNKILEQENLTTFDIWKGYVAKREFVANYEFSKENISEDIIKLVNELIEESVQETYQYLLNSYLERQNKIEELRDEYSQFEISKTVPLEKYAASKNEYLKSDTSTNFRNKLLTYTNELQYHTNMNLRIYTKVYELLSPKIKEKLGENFDILADSHNGSNFPYRIDLSTIEKENFNDKYIPLKSFVYKKSIPFQDERILFDFIKKEQYFNIDFYLVRKISESEAKEIIFKVIEKEIDGILDINPFIFAQQLESMPITINIDTKTNKIYLLDGYKRLLYVNNKELLDKEVAVKVFYDLSSQSNIDLLYASNYWKKTLGDRHIGFHDRGYLFNLKQNYGISEDMFLSNNTIGKRNESYSLLTILNLYDFIEDTYYSMATSYAKNKARKKGFSSPSEYMIDDLKQMVNLLDFERKYEYLPDVNKWLINDFIILLGCLRKDKTKEQKAINIKEILEEIFNDSKMSKILSKKTGLSSTTYIIKFFNSNKIDEWIESIIAKHMYV